MPFNPKPEYTIVPDDISIKDFHDYKEDFVTRPPYQRKVVWSKAKKQSLMDSLFRRYYIPKLVIREVRLNENETLNEIIDGQQRITTVQDFFDNKYPLPKTLQDISPDLAGKYYKDLNTEIRKFIDKSLKFQADVIRNIEERQIFFEYLKDNSVELVEKDDKRAFSELERILIYRKDKGLCQECLRENRKMKPK